MPAGAALPIGRRAVGSPGRRPAGRAGPLNADRLISIRAVREDRNRKTEDSPIVFSGHVFFRVVFQV